MTKLFANWNSFSSIRSYQGVPSGRFRNTHYPHRVPSGYQIGQAQGAPFKEGTASFGHRLTRSWCALNTTQPKSVFVLVSESVIGFLGLAMTQLVDVQVVEYSRMLTITSMHITFQRNNFFIDCTITNSTMPRGKTNYSAVLSFPEITVLYQQPSGQMVLYSME